MLVSKCTQTWNNNALHSVFSEGRVNMCECWQISVRTSSGIFYSMRSVNSMCVEFVSMSNFNVFSRLQSPVGSVQRSAKCFGLKKRYNYQAAAAFSSHKISLLKIVVICGHSMHWFRNASTLQLRARPFFYKNYILCMLEKVKITPVSSLKIKSSARNKLTNLNLFVPASPKWINWKCWRLLATSTAK